MPRYKLRNEFRSIIDVIYTICLLLQDSRRFSIDHTLSLRMIISPSIYFFFLVIHVTVWITPPPPPILLLPSILFSLWNRVSNYMSPKNSVYRLLWKMSVPNYRIYLVKMFWFFLLSTVSAAVHAAVTCHFSIRRFCFPKYISFAILF